MILVNVLLTGIILLHRYLRRRDIAFQEERRAWWAHAIDKILAEDYIPARVPAWQAGWDRDAAEDVLLGRLRDASYVERKTIQDLYRVWGLLDARRQQIRHGSSWERARSALVLGSLQFKEALPDLIWLLARVHRDTQVAIVNALELMGDPIACKALIDFLVKQGSFRDLPVLSALVACSRSQPSLLVSSLKHPQAHIREVTAQALSLTARRTELPALLPLVQDSEPGVRSSVAQALGRIREPESFAGLEQLVCDADWLVRLQAVASLEKYSFSEVKEILIRSLCDKDWRVRRKAGMALCAHAPNPADLMRELRERVPDRYALEAMVSALEIAGVIWSAIESLAASEPSQQEQSRSLLIELVRVGTVTSMLYALEAHPNSEVKAALLRVLREHARPLLRPQLEDLLPSALIEEETRRCITHLLKKWSG